jgi:hypothetical protein
MVISEHHLDHLSCLNNQVQSGALSGNRVHSGALGGNPCSSVAISGHQWLSVPKADLSVEEGSEDSEHGADRRICRDDVESSGHLPDAHLATKSNQRQSGRRSGTT